MHKNNEKLRLHNRCFGVGKGKKNGCKTAKWQYKTVKMYGKVT